MRQRRPLVAGLETSVTVDRAVEEQFVLGDKAKAAEKSVAIISPASKQEERGNAAEAISRVPLSTRIRSDFAKGLKRASLERQLSGTVPNTLQDILEDALEPWLRSNGYLS